MTDITSKINGEISSDRAGFGSQGLGLSKHLASLFDNIHTLPAHAYDGSGGEEIDESTEEFLGAQISVVLRGHFLGGGHHLESHELVSALFETSDDVSDESTLNSIGLDGEEGTLLVGTGDSLDGEGVAVGSSGGGGEEGGSDSGCGEGSSKLSREGDNGSTGGYSRHRTGLRGSASAKGSNRAGSEAGEHLGKIIIDSLEV
mmetsp:Transcript_23035/g.33724  ORF Transcript_23035/g.33724 Transcript_23035/m.33724 type:complete len:202 (-) Transcript_23035:18-623(-)